MTTITHTTRTVAGLLAALSLTTAGLGAGLAATDPSTAEAACTRTYYVKVAAVVREDPSSSARAVDNKGAFAKLTGPCYASRPNNYVAVYSSRARDGIGWVLYPRVTEV